MPRTKRSIWPETVLPEGTVEDYFPAGTLILEADFDAELLIPCYRVTTRPGHHAYISAAELHRKHPNALK